MVAESLLKFVSIRKRLYRQRNSSEIVLGKLESLFYIKNLSGSKPQILMFSWSTSNVEKLKADKSFGRRNKYSFLLFLGSVILYTGSIISNWEAYQTL